MNALSPTQPPKRMGFHYYPDYDHYRTVDLNLWLPRLQKLKVGWLTLLAPSNRAIPEPFLRGLVQAGIQPVIHFPCPQMRPPNPETLQLLLSAYADWGVRYVVLFDRPNLRRAWPKNRWTQQDLVERFLDLYLPLAELIIQAGMVPVFPPLEPGGDYWDTAFLRVGLNALSRRAHPELLNTLVLGAYACSGDRPISWGAGGPERWPAARPYFTPANQQDQRGFYIADWYRAISQATLGRPVPQILFGIGLNNTAEDNNPQPVERLLAQAQLLYEPIQADHDPLETEAGPLEPLAAEVIAGNIWLLSATANHPAARQAWFLDGSEPRPIVEAVQVWLEGTGRLPRAKTAPLISPVPQTSQVQIRHYLLLPGPKSGLSSWLLEATHPFILRHRPTVGFSLPEAGLAQQVTVVGGTEIFPEADLENLRAAGCLVTRISGDGTSIASQLATE